MSVIIIKNENLTIFGKRWLKNIHYTGYSENIAHIEG